MQKTMLDTPQICFNAHETMASSRGYEWDRNNLYCYRSHVVHNYWSKFVKCL